MKRDFPSYLVAVIVLVVMITGWIRLLEST